MFFINRTLRHLGSSQPEERQRARLQEGLRQGVFRVFLYFALNDDNLTSSATE